MNYYAFNKNISYDCEKCGGICCNINGYLSFSENEMRNPHLNQYRNFFVKNENYYICKTPKRCWFLEKEECSLGDKKPLCCKVYPLNIWTLNSRINMIEFIPCPSSYVKNCSFQNEKEYEKNATKYLKYNYNQYHQSMKYMKDDCEYITEEILNEKVNLVKNSFIFKGFRKYIYGDILFGLSEQFFMHPFVLNILDGEDRMEDLKADIENITLRYINKIPNLQNLYILINTDFYKYVLFKYYKSLAGEVCSGISSISQYYNDRQKYKQLNDIYNQKIIQWEKIL